MSGSNLNEPFGKRKWAMKLFDCRTYQNFQGKNRFFPTFCPQSCICTNVMIGRVCSRAIKEEPRNCLDLGCAGCLVCVVLSPLGVEPVFFPNFCVWVLFANITNCLRFRIRAAYNVQEEAPICFNEGSYSSNSCLEWLYFGAAFPCSLFQVYESVLYWEDEAKAKTEGDIGLKMVKEVKEDSAEARVIGVPNPITQAKY